MESGVAFMEIDSVQQLQTKTKSNRRYIIFVALGAIAALCWLISLTVILNRFSSVRLAPGEQLFVGPKSSVAISACKCEDCICTLSVVVDGNCAVLPTGDNEHWMLASLSANITCLAQCFEIQFGLSNK